MKKIIVYTLMPAVIAVSFFGVRKSGLSGSWQSGDNTLSFGCPGVCIVNSKKLNYRNLNGETVRIYSDAGYKDYGYFISNDGDTMYFGGDKYTKTQSGAERSIMEFLL